MKHSVHILSFLLAAGVLFSALLGCSKQATADSVAYRLLNLYPYLPRCSQYVKDGEPFTSGYLSPEDFFYLYTGRREVLPEWDKIEAFRLILTDTIDFFEIHVIEAMTASDADEIAALLERRAALLSSCSRAGSDYPTWDPFVCRRGRFAVLVATDDNEAARRLLDRIL